tara:strand:+ start:542 stop:787 length:246 start_codon:yes stop_codon:yes gene_type:complete
MKAKIYISYKEGILDPQGKIVGTSLASIGVEGINKVSIGKYIEMEFLDHLSKKDIKKITEKACKELLANPNTETYKFEIIE